MNSLTWNNKFSVFWIAHVQDFIGENSCCINYSFRFYFVTFFSKLIFSYYSCDFITFVFQKTYNLCIIDYGTAFFYYSLGEVNGQTGIIKLSILIYNPAGKTFLLYSRKLFNGLCFIDISGFTKAEFPSQKIVNR